MNVKQSILNKIRDGSFALHTDEQIARKLHLKKQESYRLREILLSLCREGELVHDSRFRFGTIKQFGAFEGTFSAHENGFGFFVPNDRSLSDLFIPHRSRAGALHGDRVLAIPVGGRVGDEGEILAVITRGYSTVTGTFQNARRGGYVVPDERKFAQEIYIPQNKCKHSPHNSKVLVRITSYANKSLEGEIIEILGEKGDLAAEELSLIRAHNLKEEFPDEVLSAANAEAARPVAQSIEGRLDLRNELIITVDGEDTRDIDDAISVKKEDKHYHLGVHIADVTNYVTRGSLIDREAFARGTSVYFPDRVLPMLPTALSNDICSLNEGVDRLTLSCLMKISDQGEVIESRIVPSVIRSRHRMTYTDVTKISRGDQTAREKYPDLVPFVENAVELTRILQRARAARGSISLDVKEAKILYTDGKIYLPDYERTISHEMIEQFMVLANESVAREMTNHKMPFVYRIHEPPAPEKAAEFIAFLKDLGINTKIDPENVEPSDYQQLLKSIENAPVYPLVNRVMLRSMMKAIYSPENKGHFGLASECYCHFTSPIRRYPDLCIHRIIKESFTDEEKTRERYRAFVKEAAIKSSECERNATEAEREVDALFIATYMKDKIGEEYEAVLSGVTSFGLFAELQNTVEGFIPLETLPDDSYEFLENKYILRGTHTTFCLGERVRVRVSAVDFGMRRVHFQLLEKLSESRK